MRPAAALCAVALLAPAVHAQTVHRVDGLAAVVGGTTPGAGVVTILRSDARLRAGLAGASRHAAGEPGPSAAPATAELARALDELVGEALLAVEAERVGVPPPGPAALSRESQALAGLAGGDERLSALARRAGLGEAGLAAWVARRALVRAFLEANLEGTPTVTEAQLRATFAAGGHPFDDRPYEEAREPLRAWLSQRSLETAVARWVRVLRGRTEVRILVPWPSRFAEPSREPEGSASPRPPPSSPSAPATSTP